MACTYTELKLRSKQSLSHLYYMIKSQNGTRRLNIGAS